ncbi:peptidoglycan-binding domain-containing protein [Streptomyces sp. W16]|uniref:peptidoglycan-binding domain-containing protein n=1 Tax=Streptomyces sp. W16 TaxID=3076631 RepID=UPI00295AB29E|nr:peptidoglycan-binding domain-containing protein [Streptomyces sp. W16]MDV9170803.1 peptidoglycan-binding domain-containing protein [Streptomyces sp. W16]
MNDAKGHICPQCGAPRAADGSPSCACTQRASDALRDARTAEAAAAEDFDPLRIRPYVELNGNAQDQTPAQAPPAPEGETQRLPAVEETMRLHAIPPSDPRSDPPSDPFADPFAGTFTDTDAYTAADTGTDAGTDSDPPRRRRRTVLLAAAGAVVAVVAAAGFASGMFSYETPSRDEAAPKDVRASVPTASKSTAPATPSTSASTSAQATSASPSPTLSTNPSPSTTSSPSATASRSAASSPTPTTSATASGASASDRQGGTSTAPVLQRGDEGPEVTELQLRLTQLNLYTGPDNGVFDKQVQTSVRTYQLARGIQSDTLGVYGAATRAKLESETTEP